MNEEELKNLWQSEQTAPTIDFAELQKSLNIWHDKLRRKFKIETWINSVMYIAIFVSVIIYPKLIFFALGMVAFAIWFIPQSRKLYRREQVESSDVRKSLESKISAMKKYFRQYRIAGYIFTPLLLILAFYGLGKLENPSITYAEWQSRMIKFIIFIVALSEVLIIPANEIYFAIFYKPDLNELQNLLRQLDSDEANK